MKKLFFNILIVLISLITWLILKEELSVWQVILGLALGLSSLLFNNLVLHYDLSQKNQQLHPLILPGYLFHLLIQIYIAGFITIKKIIKGDINPDIVDIETDLENDMYICFLANSITLTPGTVTIDKNGNKLKVLWLDCTTRDPQKAGEIIKGKFERILRKG